MEIVKRCRVCDDQAKGFNFNGAPSCSSCRVFFSRNSNKLRELKCRRDNQCSIDFVTRKCCPKCRLVKCFAIGMQSKTNQTINSYNEIDDNRKDCKIIESILKENLCDNSSSHSDKCDDELDTVTKPTSDLQTFELNQVEKEEIEQIREAMTVFEEEWSLPIVGEETVFVYLASRVTIYSRRMIRFCKRIPVFKALNQADQMLLLKPFCYYITVIRSAYQLDTETQRYIFLSDESGLEAVAVKFDSSYPSQYWDLIRHNRRVIRELNLELEKDRTVRNLLIVIALVKPVVAELSAQEMIRYHYFRYCHLLQRYLEQKYHCKEVADRKYANLMRFMQEDQMDAMLENSRTLLAEYGVDKIEALVLEILNLKVN